MRMAYVRMCYMKGKPTKSQTLGVTIRASCGIPRYFISIYFFIIVTLLLLFYLSFQCQSTNRLKIAHRSKQDFHRPLRSTRCFSDQLFLVMDKCRGRHRMGVFSCRVWRCGLRPRWEALLAYILLSFDDITYVRWVRCSGSAWGDGSQRGDGSL